MNTLEVLVAARAEIEKGWCKSMAINTRGDVCALGAIDAALGEDRKIPRTLARRAYERLDVVEALSTSADHIIHFNDLPSTTKEDVLARFDRAIAAEAAKVTADSSHVYAVA